MKAEIIQDVDFEKEIKFPILMRWNGSSKSVFLFYNETSGICVYGSEINSMNTNLISCKDRQFWKPFNGIIQLQNE